LVGCWLVADLLRLTGHLRCTCSWFDCRLCWPKLHSLRKGVGMDTKSGKQQLTLSCCSTVAARRH
jgi:hypothetical protein